MTVFVTGANRGIGAELVRQYAQTGEKIIATTREKIPSDLKNQAQWLELDVTNQTSFDAMKPQLDGVPISLLICNAGVYLDKNETLAEGFGPQIWQKTCAANLMGPFLTIQNLLPNLEMEQHSKIAVIASKMGSDTLAAGGSYAYRASKAAAINLARNLAVDLKPMGISVGAYHPGWVQTDMGSMAADVDVKSSAAGLISRFQALSIENTGCYETFEGQTLPF